MIRVAMYSILLAAVAGSALASSNETRQRAADAVFPDWGQIFNRLSRLPLSVAANSMSDQAKIEQRITGGHRWAFKRVSGPTMPDGSRVAVPLNLVAEHSGKCMDVLSADDGTVLVQNTCAAGRDSQVFYWLSSSLDLISKPTGKCLEMGPVPGDQLVLSPCNGGKRQDFSIPAFYDGPIRNANSGKYINFGSTKDGVCATQSATQSETWSLVWSHNHGAYNVVSKNTGKCIEVSGGNPDNGAPLIQMPCFDMASSQVFGIEFDFLSRPPVATLVAAHSGKCVEIGGGDRSEGAKLNHYTCNGTPAQTFWLPADEI